jgi:carboxylesterase type B
MRFKGEFANGNSTPVVDGDFIPDSPSKLVSSGRFYKNIPIIAGWNSNDGSLFVPENLTTDASLGTFLQTKWTNLNDSTVAQILAQYPLASFAPSGPFPAQFSRASRIFRDFRFTCGELDFAYHVTAAGSTSHLYALNQTVLSAFIPSFFGGKTSVSIYQKNTNKISHGLVTHISDVPYVFDEVSFVVKNVSASDTALASTMSSLWAAFASATNLVSTDFGTIWPAAYSSSATPWPTSAGVKIFGGPDEGIASFGAMSALNAPGEEDTLSRCQFVASIFDQLGT